MEPIRTYKIYKGTNRPLEFRGLKAQYIGRLVATVLGNLVGYVGLHLAGVNSYLALIVALGVGAWMAMRLYRLSNTYGQYGWMKRRACRRIPAALAGSSRRLFKTIYGKELRVAR